MITIQNRVLVDKLSELYCVNNTCVVWVLYFNVQAVFFCHDPMQKLFRRSDNPEPVK